MRVRLALAISDPGDYTKSVILEDGISISVDDQNVPEIMKPYIRRAYKRGGYWIFIPKKGLYSVKYDFGEWVYADPEDDMSPCEWFSFASRGAKAEARNAADEVLKADSEEVNQYELSDEA